VPCASSGWSSDFQTPAAFAKGFTLPANLDLALGLFGDEGAAGLCAGQIVDAGG